MQQHYPLNPQTGLEDPLQLPWIDGNPATGTDGSFPPFALCTEPMYEIVNVITKAGLTPTSADLTQLYEAIVALIANAVGAIKVPVIPAFPQIPGAGEGNGIDANGNIAWNIASLTEEDTISDSDLFGFFQSIVGGGQPAGHARKVNAGALAAYMIAKVTAAEASQVVAGSAFTYFAPGIYQWVVPAGVTRVKRLWIWGGGGGGGSSGGEAGSASGGGGGGFSLSVNVPVTPGQTITLAVGAGGAAGAGGGDGGAGGTSSFGSLASSTGGAGGANDQGSTFNGSGYGGTGSGNFMNFTGGAGGVPFAAGYEGFEPVGGAGGAAPFGNGSTYINTNAAGLNGGSPGGGGSGGSVGNPGGPGASGYVAFEI